MFTKDFELLLRPEIQKAAPYTAAQTKKKAGPKRPKAPESDIKLVVEQETAIKALNKAELQKLCSTHHLPKTGTKGKLQCLILQKRQELILSDAVHSVQKAPLVTLCQEAGISSKGKKEELIASLQIFYKGRTYTEEKKKETKRSPGTKRKRDESKGNTVENKKQKVEDAGIALAEAEKGLRREWENSRKEVSKKQQWVQRLQAKLDKAKAELLEMEKKERQAKENLKSVEELVARTQVG